MTIPPPYVYHKIKKECKIFRWKYFFQKKNIFHQRFIAALNSKISQNLNHLVNLHKVITTTFNNLSFSFKFASLNPRKTLKTSLNRNLRFPQTNNGKARTFCEVYRLC